MDWTKALLALVVILLYIPLVFMGANVFFPEYTGSHSYYSNFKTCDIAKGSADVPVYQQNQTCAGEQQAAQDAFEQAKAKYDGNKYIFIVGLSLFVLLLALFISFDESVIIGLFLGSVLTSFFSTWIYFSTQSKIGFALLAVIFFITLFFITKLKSMFFVKAKK
ncbi:hypothetical protein HZA98_03335 [Candidatus Woesearchaeota archaeon]|nr:hypothetical protein [Candidatus Woesearchaeota archaeon]